MKYFCWCDHRSGHVHVSQEGLRLRTGWVHELSCVSGGFGRRRQSQTPVTKIVKLGHLHHGRPVSTLQPSFGQETLGF